MHQRRGWFLTCALLASACTQGGAALVGIILVARVALSAARRQPLLDAALFVAAYGALSALATIDTYFRPRGETIFSSTNLAQYWAQWPDATGVGIQLLFFVITTGGVMLVAIPLMRGRDPWSLQLFAAALIYAGLLAAASRINPHYFLAPSLLVLLAFTRRLSLMSRPQLWGTAVLASVVVTVWLIRPAGDATPRHASDLGRRLGFETTDYQTQVSLARIIHERFPFPRYGIAHHTLVHYASRSRCRDCDYLITESDGADRRGFEVSRQAHGAALWSRPGLVEPLDTQLPRSGCAPFLRRLYTAYHRRVEPQLAGPAILPWMLCLDR
jgi:hypothetical protein